MIGEKMGKIFDGKRNVKLGTSKHPAVVNVKQKKEWRKSERFLKKTAGNVQLN